MRALFPSQIPTTTIPSQIDSIDLKKEAEHIVETITTTPADELMKMVLNDALEFGLKVLAAIVIYAIGAWLIRKVKKILNGVFERRHTEKAIASFLQSLISITLTILLIILTVGTLGINTTSLAALLAAGGMAIGMALSGTVQNFAGGIMLLVFKPFKAGDYIEAQGFSGTVSDVNIVSTKLTTVDNKTIVIPNGSLSNGTINNFSQNPVRRVDWKVGVEYGSDSAKTMALLMKIMKSDSRIIVTEDGTAPAPVVVLTELADSAVVFTAKAWVKTSDYWDVLYAINNEIYTQLPENGINFPFPQMDVHIKQ